MILALLRKGRDRRTLRILISIVSSVTSGLCTLWVQLGNGTRPRRGMTNNSIPTGTKIKKVVFFVVGHFAHRHWLLRILKRDLSTHQIYLQQTIKASVRLIIFRVLEDFSHKQTYYSCNRPLQLDLILFPSFQQIVPRWSYRVKGILIE